MIVWTWDNHTHQRAKKIVNYGKSIMHDEPLDAYLVYSETVQDHECTPSR